LSDFIAIYGIIQIVKIGGIVKTKVRGVRFPHIVKLTRKQRKKAWLYGVGGFVLLIILIFAVNLKDLPTPSKLASLHASESTKILDRNGSVLYATGEEHRTVINSQDIPDTVKQATVAAEDATFYTNHGLDFKGIARAAWRDITRGKKTEGGSTITQQFVKNAILTGQKTFTRKIREAILALEIEQIYTKDQILTMYLNEIPYGGNIYGIQEASKTFFEKDPKDLTLSESATLAAILNAPTYYSPYGTHTDDLFARKNYVLNRMAKLGYVSQVDADAAKTQSPDKLNPKFTARHESINAPHFVMYVKEKLVEQYGEKMVDSGGLKVTTSLDLDKQKKAEDAIASGSAKLDRYGATNAALVSEDVKTGEILAMVGSRDYFDIENDGNVNVTDSERQPGSSFKPIVYATAFKQSRYSPSFNLFDVRTDFGNYTPNNYDGSTHGAVTMRTALSNSLNIPAVKTLALVGVPEALKTAKDLGITTLNQPDRYGLSLVLGGGEVKPIEMAGAFGAFSDAGTYHQPTSILKVEDSKGKTIYEYKSEANKFQAVDPQVAYEISNVLDDDEARQMVFGSNNALDFGPDYHVAAKTGTTQEFHDAWTIGYSTQIATAVWVGNNDNTKMSNGADGSVVAAPIFHSYMANFSDNKEDFQRPPGIQEVTVEKYSNKLPTQYSQNLIKDIFASFQVPTDKDDVNVALRVNKANNQLATDSTPAELIEEKIFANIHNEWGPAWKDHANWEGPVRAWADANGMPLPSTGSDDSYSKRPAVSISTPTNGATVSGSVSVAVSASSDQGVSNLTYFLDDTSIGSNSSSPYSITFDSTKYTNGIHKLTARLTDNNGVTSESSIQINIQNNANISNVSISGITTNAALIGFKTDIKTNSTVSYSLDQNNLNLTVTSGSSTTNHQASLNGLQSGKKYYFRINAGSSVYTGNFTTL